MFRPLAPRTVEFKSWNVSLYTPSKTSFDAPASVPESVMAPESDPPFASLDEPASLEDVPRI
jgi:hypothetical protein